MTTLLLILWVLIALSIVAPLSVHPERSKRGWSELKRRGDEQALRRERHFETVERIRIILMLGKVTILTLVSLVLWQGWGIVMVIAFLVITTPLARLAFVRSGSNKLYTHIERKLLNAVEASSLLNWLTSPRKFIPKNEKLESEAQLQHLIETSGDVLDEHQKAILLNGLKWHHAIVASVMTKRSDIVSVKHSELLGPLVLDDLHKSGHSRFPVIKGSLDTTIGILDITELVEIDAGKTSTTAEKSMHPQALRIGMDETLPAALALLQKSHQHVLLVIDAEGKTVGLLTLSDVTGSLLR